MAGLFDSIMPYAGSIIGGLLGSKAGGDQQQTSTATKDPWAPAQPYMLDNLKNEAALQKYYQKTPFNQQQIEGYSNLFGDIGNFRDNVAPGLMDFANKGMTSSYSRQTGGAPGSGGGYGGTVRPGGMSQSGTGPFSVAQGAGQRSTGVNGLLDLNGAMNPHMNGGIVAPTATTAAAVTPAATSGLLSNGSGNGSVGGGSGSGLGGSLSAQQAALSAMALSENPAIRAMAPTLAALLGIGGGAVADQQMGVIGNDMAALNAQDPTSGMGTLSDLNANVRTYSSPETIAAANRAMFGGFGTSSYSGDPHGGYGSNGNTNDGAGGYGGRDNGY